MYLLSQASQSERPLTLRQRRFVQLMLDPETKSQSDAARKAGYSHKIAAYVGSTNLMKQNVSTALDRARARKRDKASGLGKLADKVLEHGMGALTEVEAGQALAIGSQMKKLAKEIEARYGQSEAAVKEAEQESAHLFDSYAIRLWRLASRLSRRYGADRTLQQSSQAPAIIERWVMRTE